MTNKIIGIQGDKLDKINISSDTSIFLAHEAQKLGYKIFYYTPSSLSIIKNKTYAKHGRPKTNIFQKVDLIWLPSPIHKDENDRKWIL